MSECNCEQALELQEQLDLALATIEVLKKPETYEEMAAKLDKYMANKEFLKWNDNN